MMGHVPDTRIGSVDMCLEMDIGKSLVEGNISSGLNNRVLTETDKF